jgi:hypothetical protein
MKFSIIRNTGFLLAAVMTIMSCATEIPEEDAVSQFRPAQFTGTRSSLENQIRFPRYEGDISIQLNCYAVVTIQGRLSTRYCRSDHEDTYDFARMVYSASFTTRMISAKVGVSEEDAQIMYAVRFVKEGNEENIEVFLHHLGEEHRYAYDYIAPQRVQIYTSRWSVGNRCPFEAAAVWMNVRVSAEGKPLEVSVKDTDRYANRECIEYISDYLADQDWVPAMQNGEYVEADYTEIFFEGYRRKFDIN